MREETRGYLRKKVTIAAPSKGGEPKSGILREGSNDIDRGGSRPQARKKDRKKNERIASSNQKKRAPRHNKERKNFTRRRQVDRIYID